MNLFGKIKFIIGTFVASSLLLTIAYFNQMQKLVEILIVLVPLQALLVLILASILMNGYKQELLKANTVLKKVANGNLYHRITHIDKTNNNLAHISWNINNLLDQIEAFSRDISSSLKGIAKGDMTRKMLPSGLHGDFVRVSNEINEALEVIAVAQSKDEFIQKMIITLDSYAKGDYRPVINVEGMQEDIVQLAHGINSLGAALNEFSKINYENGLMLKKGSIQLTQNVSILTKAANLQATSLEETSVALDEITKSMQHSNQNTHQMAQYAEELTSSANDGEKLANETTVSMDEINEEVEAINEAITVIDQIAFQTNILSLNAAVEAATAGETGKGFAVVAQEVRNLATRSAQAAKEIKTLVENATSKANHGKEIASKMINGYDTLNTNIKLTMDLLKDITVSSKEQEKAIVQINDSIAILDKNMQENAKVARDTNEIALQSNEISHKIVELANKEFDGKEELQAKFKSFI
ncbi:MAG: methyl-accepting chemotaxis protein [Arcobacteraceae bacterium]